MTTEVIPLNMQSPAFVYARLLVESQRLIDGGKGDSEEAEALAERMDAPWYALTSQEQARMEGLSADLHTLKEGGPKRVDMSSEEFATWQRDLSETYNKCEAGDPNTLLEFLRRPVPSQTPPHTIPFLQGRCWERLGDLETALLFIKEADRLNPDYAIPVLVILLNLGRVDEWTKYTDRIIENPATSPLDLYLAGVSLVFSTRWKSEAEAKPILRRAEPSLRRALSGYLALPPDKKAEAPPNADAQIAQALGLALEQMGNFKSAIAVYNEALARHPGDGDLFMARGFALYETDLPSSLNDLVKAVRLGVAAISPYLLLARHALQGRLPLRALELAQAAERQPGAPFIRAQVYETIAMALAELGQPNDRILENFDKALALDPNNERIRENRTLAADPPSNSLGERKGRVRFRQAPPIKTESLRRAARDQVKFRSEWLFEQRSSRVSGDFVHV